MMSENNDVPEQVDDHLVLHYSVILHSLGESINSEMKTYSSIKSKSTRCEE